MLKFKIIRWLLRYCDFILICNTPYTDGTHDGLVMESVTGEPDGKDGVAGVLTSCMENRPAVTDAILKACLNHLKRYEVAEKNFIEKLYEK